MKQEELEKWLNDFDNLKETGHFKNKQIEECVFFHKEMNMEQFLQKGREIIRQSLMHKKGLLK